MRVLQPSAPCTRSCSAAFSTVHGPTHAHLHCRCKCHACSQQADFFCSLQHPSLTLRSLQEFYELGTKHRKLTWIYSLGQCTMTAHFAARPVDLVLQGLQASVLLLFNDGA